MSKPKEIPSAMLDAAAHAILRTNGHPTDGWIAPYLLGQATAEAKAALEAADVPKILARIAELEADAKRLRWLMDNSGIDGFYGVVDDRYDFALRLASERNHDEPTDDDEFDGWRRLIDAAMKSAGGE